MWILRIPFLLITCHSFLVASSSAKHSGEDQSFLLLNDDTLFSNDSDVGLATSFPSAENTANVVKIKYGSNITHEKIITLEPYSHIILQAFNISKNAEYAVFQAHSQIHPLVMSHGPELEPENHSNGTNIGLFVKLGSESRKKGVYLMNPQPYNVTALVFVLFYDKSAPIPGGCNMEFEVDIAPWLKVRYDSSSVSVEHAPAARPSRSGRPHSCSSPSPALHYEVFHLYMNQRDFSQESFFQAIRQLRTPQDARDNGREIRSFGFVPTTRSLFSLYPGIGRVFVVTVTYTDDNDLPAAAYIPVVTYGCDLSLEGDCQTLGSTYSKVLCAGALFVGLFVAFLGHRYFQVEMFVVGFVTFASISYVVLVNLFDPNATGLAAGSSVMGVLGGLLWWFIWWFWGIPALSVLPVVLMFGFLVASIFFYLPISFEFLTHDFNFWSSFTCCWLVFPVIFVTFTRAGNIISCAVLGSYAVIVPIDHYIGSSLKYIVMNVVRRATVRDFGKVVLDPPYQDNDLILTLAWLSLAVSGAVFQFVRERKRPPFSPPAEMWRRTGHVSAPSEQTPLLNAPAAAAT